MATPRNALEAAAGVARSHGVTPWILVGAIEGEARVVAATHADLACQVATGQFEFGGKATALPIVLLSGGDTTVTVRGKDRGGRNTEYMLALALALGGNPAIYALAAEPTGSMVPRKMPAR